MDEDRYQRAKELFLAACDLPPEEREAMLQRECAGDAELRADVESLLTPDAPTAAVGRAPFADLAPEKPQAMPRTIGPYRVSHELGRGGMGIIYLGAPEAGQFKRRVAIKVLRRGTDTERVLHRFELERQVLSAMNHPGIARLYDAGETEDGVPYFVMEYVDGLPLGEYCDAHRLHIDERLELFRKVCAAVHYAHQNLVVHRDLKPSNIIVTADGQPKLLDFGIAKLVNPEMSLISGSPTAPGCFPETWWRRCAPDGWWAPTVPSPSSPSRPGAPLPGRAAPCRRRTGVSPSAWMWPRRRGFQEARSVSGPTGRS